MVKVLAGIWPWTRNSNLNFSLPSPKWYSREIKPVKVAFDVFKSEATEISLPPVIIMHGLFGSKRNWSGIGQKLESKLKRKIYCIDARNHGDSPHDSNHTSAHMTEDIKELMHSGNMTKASLVGHSMGGRTMMYLALKYPNLVERMVIIDISPFSLPKTFADIEQVFLAMKNISVPSNISLAKARPIVKDQIKSAVKDENTLNFIMMNLEKSESGEFVWRSNVSSLYTNFRHNSSFKKDIASLGSYLGPVMFICGTRSPYFMPNQWLDIQKIFPSSEINWIDAGHLIHLEQPAQLVDLIVKFLKT